MTIFQFKDSLHHPQFSWPKTLLTWEAALSAEMEPGKLVMEDIQGRPVPFQLWDVEKEPGRPGRAKVSVVSGLVPGEEKQFCLRPGTPAAYPVAEFDLTLDSPDSVFVLRYAGVTFRARLPVLEKSCRVKERGCLFSDYEIQCSLAGGGEYAIQLRLIRDMPFFELREEIRGGAAEKLEIRLEDFDPVKRYSWCRPEEKIDAYLTRDGYIPVTILPYENWNPWFQSKYIEFADGNLACGLFIRDSEQWDDGKYAIWGSDPDMGIRIRYDGTVTWEFPLAPGRRFTGIGVYSAQIGYIEELWTWYAFLHLDKVKDWILEWPAAQSEYPLFWKGAEAGALMSNAFGGEIGQLSMNTVIDRLSKTMAAPGKINPVDCREFADWAVIFDVNANKMDQAEFDRARAAMAFMAYAAIDENYMPTRKMLAGHPNFLADVAAMAGYMAAVLPSHPDRDQWAAFFQNAVRKNLCYHLRPDVAAWQSKGGRPTENTACYNFASLVPQIRVCMLFDRCGLENPLTGPLARKWLFWQVNSLSAPVDGRRLYLPQGAHAGKFHHGYVEIPYSLLEFARMNERDDPALAQCVYAACQGSPLVSHEIEDYEKDPWRSLYTPREAMGAPALRSEKFTGYGYILRSNVGTENEISIHLQQLDFGPNYRWGTFENTGNGGIYYFAAGKRYSYNAAEETGDRNLDACAGSCNFAVLAGHTYHNIGFGDLENPLHNLGFVQGAALNADPAVAYLYRERSIMLVGGEYLAVYDRVDDITTKGRFSWFVNQNEEFPYIHQLRPGVEPKPYPPAQAVDTLGERDPETRDGFLQKGIGFDGRGDFFTIVTHLPQLQARRREYGAEIILPGRRDLVFDDSAKIRYQEEHAGFIGYRGVISRADSGDSRGAVLCGEMILLDGIQISCGKPTTAVSIEIRDGKINGKLHLTREDILTWTILGKQEARTLPAGQYVWRWKDGVEIAPVPDPYIYMENTAFKRNIGRHEFGFSGFDFRRRKTNWTYPFAQKGDEQ